MEKDPEHRLPLVHRQKIWAALGPRNADDGAAGLTVPHVRRARLALSSAEQVLPLWKKFDAQDADVADLIMNTARKYLQGAVPRFDANRLVNSFYAKLEHPYPESSALHAGQAIAGALGVALSDELFGPDHEVEGTQDRAADPYDWDTAFNACLAYSLDGDADEQTTRLRRHDFWKWYLLDAVPAAWNLQEV